MEKEDRKEKYSEKEILALGWPNKYMLYMGNNGSWMCKTVASSVLVPG